MKEITKATIIDYNDAVKEWWSKPIDRLDDMVAEFIRDYGPKIVKPDLRWDLLAKGIRGPK